MSAERRKYPVLYGTHITDEMSDRIDQVIAAKIADGEAYKECTRSALMREALEIHLKKLEMVYL